MEALIFNLNLVEYKIFLMKQQKMELEMQLKIMQMILKIILILKNLLKRLIIFVKKLTKIILQI